MGHAPHAGLGVINAMGRGLGIEGVEVAELEGVGAEPDPVREHRPRFLF